MRGQRKQASAFFEIGSVDQVHGYFISNVQSTSLAMPLHNVGMLDPTWMSYFCAKA
jgi:hypothetical protein